MVRWSSLDSPLEESGFEPSVPLCERGRSATRATWIVGHLASASGTNVERDHKFETEIAGGTMIRGLCAGPGSRRSSLRVAAAIYRKAAHFGTKVAGRGRL
jgi:hypothetical protein